MTSRAMLKPGLALLAAVAVAAVVTTSSASAMSPTDNVQTTVVAAHPAMPNDGSHLFNGSQYVTTNDVVPEEDTLSRNEAYLWIWNSTAAHALQTANKRVGGSGVSDWTYSWYGGEYLSLFGGTDAYACVTHTWRKGTSRISVSYCDQPYEDYGDSSINGADPFASPWQFSVFAQVSYKP